MIDLTTDFNPGDDYSDGPYTHVAPTIVNHNSQRKIMVVDCYYGAVAASVFTPGSYHPKGVDIIGDDYDAFTAMISFDGESINEAVLRCLSQQLINQGSFAGTVV